MNKPEALRLAAELEACPSINYKAHAAELRRLHAENFALAAGQCMNVVGDEGGTPICAKAEQLQAARERDNVSFKQLLAQRDTLLEALKYHQEQTRPIQKSIDAIAKAEGEQT